MYATAETADSATAAADSSEGLATTENKNIRPSADPSRGKRLAKECGHIPACGSPNPGEASDAAVASATHRLLSTARPTTINPLV